MKASMYIKPLSEEAARIGMRAENKGMYSVDSKLSGIVYVYNEDEYGIVGCGGVMRITESALKTMLKELNGIVEDVKYLRNRRMRE